MISRRKKSYRKTTLDKEVWLDFLSFQGEFRKPT